MPKASRPCMLEAVGAMSLADDLSTDRAERAFHHVSDIEGDLNQVQATLRMILMLDTAQVFNSDEEASAIIDLVLVATKALERVWEKRSLAFTELHPFAYPASHGLQ